ncbi:Myosin 10A, isoform D [Phlyctochytrium bullatum]|nr:Myosin 10A, isoform D [Phlyctochytrium bullatum]
MATLRRHPALSPATPRPIPIKPRISLPIGTPRDSTTTLRVDTPRPSLYLPFHSPTTAVAPSSPRRTAALTRFVESERRYLFELRRTVEFYLDPIRQSGLLSPRDIAKVFGNFEEVLAAHETFYRFLLSASDASSLDIAAVLTQLAKTLEPYTTYLPFLPRALTRLHALRSHRAFTLFLATIHGLMPAYRRVGLQGFLLDPCQRICAYRELVEELVACVEGEKGEWAVREAAGRVMEKVEVAVGRGEKAVERRWWRREVVKVGARVGKWLKGRK